MELDGIDIPVLVPESLHTALVYVDVRDCGHLRADALGADHIAVVLRGDEHPAGVQVLHRMIGAPVAEAHLPGGSAGGQRHELMS